MSSLQQTSRSSDWLKLIAVMAMVIDHVGWGFFANDIVMRSIGRIVFPIFAYQIAVGYLHTRDPKKYMSRLFTFALISQIPFTLYFETFTLNVLVTLLLGLVSIYLLDKKKYIFLLPVIAFAIFVPMDYGLYGVMFPVIIYLLRDKPKWVVVLSIFIWTLGHMIYYEWTIQIFAVVGLIMALYLPLPDKQIRLPRYFFYAFYPLHLIVLFIVKWIFIFYYVLV